MRRLIVAVGLLAACGLPAQFAIGAGPATATPPAAYTSVSTTKAQAVAFARAVNLTGSDVPGFKAPTGSSAGPEAAGGEHFEHQLMRCAHVAPTKPVAELDSSDFERESATGDEGVQSSVTIAPSSAVASEGLAAARTRHARACVSRYLTLLFAGKRPSGAKVRLVSITPSTPAAPGTGGSYAWHISLVIAVKAVNVPTYVDILGFVDGPAEVSLSTFSAPRPFPAAAEKRLFSLLVSRATATGSP
jgi:hypothetical protein